MIVQIPFARKILISTYVIQITGVSLRGKEYNIGISNDRGRVNTATPSAREKTKKAIINNIYLLSLVIELGHFSYQYS